MYFCLTTWTISEERTGIVYIFNWIQFITGWVGAQFMDYLCAHRSQGATRVFFYLYKHDDKRLRLHPKKYTTIQQSQPPEEDLERGKMLLLKNELKGHVDLTSLVPCLFRECVRVLQGPLFQCGTPSTYQLFEFSPRSLLHRNCR